MGHIICNTKSKKSKPTQLCPHFRCLDRILDSGAMVASQSFLIRASSDLVAVMKSWRLRLDREIVRISVALTTPF